MQQLVGFLCTSNENPKVKLGNNFIYDSIKKNKILRHKFNRGEARLKYWK